jgi:hypothetical protein
VPPDPIGYVAGLTACSPSGVPGDSGEGAVGTEDPDGEGAGEPAGALDYSCTDPEVDPEANPLTITGRSPWECVLLPV